MLYQSKNSFGQCFFECIRYEDRPIPLHMHRHPELICVREGSLMVEMNHKKECVQEGEFALILSNCMHSYHSDRHFVVDICIFAETYVPQFSKNLQKKHTDTLRFLCRPSVADFAKRELFVTDHIPDLYTLKGALYAVLGEYLNQAVFSPLSDKNQLLLNQIIYYISQHYMEHITLKDMAQALGYESHYLSRCFHRLIPVHFSQYVNWYRVDAATELLLNTDLSISEIAFRSGFQSLRNFNRVYHELTGFTPSQMLTGHPKNTGRFLQPFRSEP